MSNILEFCEKRPYRPRLDAAFEDYVHAQADYYTEQQCFDHKDKHRMERYRAARDRLNLAREFWQIAYRVELVNRGRVM